MRFPVRYNVGSVTQRKVRSTLTAAGVAVAVFISVVMLALARGLLSGVGESGSPQNVLVLSQGAESMEFSAIDPSVFHLIRSAPQIDSSADGSTLASPEAYISTFVTLTESAQLGERRGVVRGIWPNEALSVHRGVRIVEGRAPERGFEVMVGQLAATKLGVSSEALAVGSEISFEGHRWDVVGIFDAGGAVFDSELWAHLDDVLVASKRTDYSAIVLATPSAVALEELLFDLTTRTDVRVAAQAEDVFYSALANRLRPVQLVGVVMTVLLVTGAVLAGMNTMFASVLGRVREFGVLFVLGYRRPAVAASLVLESVALCLVGGVIGVLLGLALDGVAMRVPMGAFRFSVDGMTVATGLGLSLVIGVLGAAVPVGRVARLPTVDALRAV